MRFSGETDKLAESLWNKVIFLVYGFPVTKIHDALESEEILENFFNLKMFWHFL